MADASVSLQEASFSPSPSGHRTLVDRLRPCAAAASERKPRIRTITAFVRIDSSQYRQQIEEGVAVLRQAKTAFERGGYLRPHMEHIRHTGGVCPRLSSPVDFDPVPIL